MKKEKHIPYFKSVEWQQKLKERHLKKVRDVVSKLKEKGGYAPRSELTWISSKTLKKMILERVLVRVELNMKRGKGPHRRRGKEGNIFREIYQGRIFIVLNDKTTLVRFFAKVIKPFNASDLGKRRMVHFFLRKYLTRAETVAVMWKLGIKSWEHMRGLMMIDSVVK